MACVDAVNDGYEEANTYRLIPILAKSHPEPCPLSERIVKAYNPSCKALQGKRSVSINGDGNCCVRSVSLYLCGDEKLLMHELRCRMVMEHV